MSRNRLAIAKAVYARRMVRGLTQAELAKLAGVSRRTVQTIESLDGDPYIGTVDRVLRVLGCALRLRRAPSAGVR